MAKTTRASADSYTAEELADPVLPIRIQRAELGRVDQSAGTDSSEFSGRGQNQSNDPNVSPQGLAPTMENPSGQSQSNQESSTAPLMGGDTQTTEKESDEEEILPYSEWTKEDLVAECREREIPVSGTKSELVARLEENDTTFEDD